MLLPRRNSHEAMPITTLQESMNRLFDDLAGGFGAVAGPATDFAPSLDISESDDAVHVRVELPGVKPEEVEVSVTGNTLTLRGEKKTEKIEKGESWHRLERRYGSFVRSVELPAAIDSGKVNATARNGVLTVTLPKHERARPKTVQVKVE